MFLERRTVSRKTPGDGKLEISPESAELLRSAGQELDIELGGIRAAGRLETMACACRKVGRAHEHHFVVSELLKSLREATEVSLQLVAPRHAGEARALVMVEAME